LFSGQYRWQGRGENALRRFAKRRFSPPGNPHPYPEFVTMSKRAFFELAANEKYGTNRYILAVNKLDGDGKLRSLKQLEDVASCLLPQFTGEDNPKPCGWRPTTRRKSRQ
jgi:hypothetical protein